MTQRISSINGLSPADVMQVADHATQLPTKHQVMHAACLMVADSLQLVIKEAIDPTKWRDEYHDAISAVEVALDIVRSLEVVGACALDDHTDQWWRAASVARLAMGALPDKETAIWRHLCNAVNEFVVLQNFVDFVSEKLAQKGGAV
ncbi:hypothetical protein [Comamonas sp. NoAH]|uniref:hypothetical protein n=1 Tax=Comamonas halotolerans TaxID=3041496 RepID=UPI0024E08A03|nr:hypothetical protein [Comamonas sp. NoAH]